MNKDAEIMRLMAEANTRDAYAMYLKYKARVEELEAENEELYNDCWVGAEIIHDAKARQLMAEDARDRLAVVADALAAEADDFHERYVICCEDSRLMVEAERQRADRLDAALRDEVYWLLENAGHAGESGDFSASAMWHCRVTKLMGALEDK